MDILSYNRQAWDRAVERGNLWTIPVSSEVVDLARQGKWSVVLTPTTPVPSAWFPPLKGKSVLCLAGAGGQQAPILAAAGAQVTVLDNSSKQLEQDAFVAARDGLKIGLVQGDMADLRTFSDQSFDFIFHPCSNCFVPDVKHVWREAFRVMRSGGVLLAGFNSPVPYMFDQELMTTQNLLQVRFQQPYSDLTSLTDAERSRYTSYDAPLEFGHTLTDQIGGQLAAGFLLTDFYEDDWGGQDIVDRYMKSFLATRAIKLT